MKCNNDNNNTTTTNNGNFICVFECTIVNLATYSQFTNAAWDWIIKNKQKTNKNKNKNKTKQNQKKIERKKRKQNCIKSGLSHFLLQQKT